MERHEVMFPISSSKDASHIDVKPGNASNIHVKKAELFLKTIRKDTSKQKGSKEIMKHKYVFQTRSQIDILDDGFRWRKYGEKSVKNNKYPRFV
jgi:hypothetical protein